MRRPHRNQRRNLPPPPAPPPDPTAMRRRRWGEIVGVVWYLGGFLALVAGAATQVGPYAWAAAWQQRHWGRESVLFSFLPGFLLLLSPLALLAWLPHRQDRPFLLGLQEAIWSARRPRPTIPAAQAGRMLLVSRVTAGLAAVALLGGGVAAWWSMQPGEQQPGAALPVIGLAAAAAPEARLPLYVRVEGAVAHPEQAWEHDYTIRATSYRDSFVPLTGPGWRRGEPIAVLQLDDRFIAEHPGPAEGTIGHGRVPSWQIAAMREAGLDVTDDPAVLRRLLLEGRVPAPDEVDAFAVGLVGVAVALVFGCLSLSFRLACRRLTRAAGGPTRPS